MNETTTLWIFGILIGGMYTFVGGATAMAFSVIQRIAKLEAINSLYSDKAAAILHSPHTPEMDALLEKFRDEYVNRHQELSFKEWQRLEELTRQIYEDKSIPKGERNLAAWMNAICDHKLLKDSKKYKLD